MRFPEDAPFVAFIVGACIVAAIIVISLSIFADELCARQVVHFC